MFNFCNAIGLPNLKQKVLWVLKIGASVCKHEKCSLIFVIKETGNMFKIRRRDIYESYEPHHTM